ncbi:MAG: hypothetical protein AABW49_01995 [Nanoarchaeota archaeon]
MKGVDIRVSTPTQVLVVVLLLASVFFFGAFVQSVVGITTGFATKDSRCGNTAACVQVVSSFKDANIKYEIVTRDREDNIVDVIRGNVGRDGKGPVHVLGENGYSELGLRSRTSLNVFVLDVADEYWVSRKPTTRTIRGNVMEVVTLNSDAVDIKSN